MEMKANLKMLSGFDGLSEESVKETEHNSVDHPQKPNDHRELPVVKTMMMCCYQSVL
jgi:hypothetical protein